MPTYGYRCPTGHEFEVWQSMSDEAAANCPECGQAAQRRFFPAGIVFKGSGFYKTDSRKPDTSTGGGSTSAPKTDAGSDGTGSSASKSDAGSGSGSAPSKGERGSGGSKSSPPPGPSPSKPAPSSSD